MNDDEFLNDRDCTPKGETPRTDKEWGELRTRGLQHACSGLLGFSRELERELISAQIDAGIWKERAEHAEQNCGRAIEIALEKTQAELARALRVVEAAKWWLHDSSGTASADVTLCNAIEEWEAGR